MSESAEGARLLSEYTGINLYRGFKSLSLRHREYNPLMYHQRVFLFKPIRSSREQHAVAFPVPAGRKPLLSPSTLGTIFSCYRIPPSSSRHQRQNNRAASHLFREKLTMSGWYEKPDSLLQGCPARCCCSDCFTPAGNRREKAPDGFRAPFPVSLHYDERLRPAGWLFLFMPRSRKCSAKTFSEK